MTKHDLDYDHIDELNEISGDEHLVLIWCDSHRAWEWHWIDRHPASFNRGETSGFLGYVPHEAGLETMNVVRRYFNRAIKTMNATERVRV
jgi:hypothetical protein